MSTSVNSDTGKVSISDTLHVVDEGDDMPGRPPVVALT